MATSKKPKICSSNCNNNDSLSLCAGCSKLFCSTHMVVHRQELSDKINKIREQCNLLLQEDNQSSEYDSLLDQINQWEKNCIEMIQTTAKTARTDLKHFAEQRKKQMSKFNSYLSNVTYDIQHYNNVTEADLDQHSKKLTQLRKEVNALVTIELLQDNSAPLALIKVNTRDQNRNNQTHLPSQNTPPRPEDKSNQDLTPGVSAQGSSPTAHQPASSIRINTSLPSQSSSYLSITYGLDSSSNQHTKRLFKHLLSLAPMDKNGPMNGKCGPETDQMEQFLSRTFDFRNIPGEYIVQGVKSFRLGKPLSTIDPNKLIRFPRDTGNSFDMKANEILDWQRSYKVYVFKTHKEMDEVFLRRALEGKSEDGKEAFCMKFVVRISTCPILMEFDAKIIPRSLNEDWPNRIKLVSVTGIDFAGRKHDEGDIRHYVSNWRDIFEIDGATDRLILCNERDLYRKENSPRGNLHEDRLLRDLTDMARLRLRACDAEGVQFVVETGIGLGVFSGEIIGVDEQVRITSAIAIRSVLEQDGSSYKNILGIIFALPIFQKTRLHQPVSDAFHAFSEQFHEPQYNGRIPVLIADQDMHRLAVAIAKEGFIVSELNPADSHGVYGEYWQNRGPAVEEKLALTTVGLLVQHHIINPHVLDINNYRFI